MDNIEIIKELVTENPDLLELMEKEFTGVQNAGK